MRNGRFPRLARAVRDYAVQYTDPIELTVGSLVSVERQDAENPGWWWCVGPDARAGWVPAELIEPDPAPGAHGRARSPHSARELPVRCGESVFVLREVSGWLLLQNSHGTFGWAPATHVQYVAST
jgi:hypothetical protein